MDGDRDPDRPPATARAVAARPVSVPSCDDRLERVDVAQLVAQRQDAAWAVPIDEPCHGLPLASGLARPQVHDGAAAVVGEAMDEPQTALDDLDGRHDRGPRRRNIVGLPDVERDRRPLAFDEQPGGGNQRLLDTGREGLGRVTVDVVGRVGRRDQPLRTGTAREDAVLEPVVAEILHAADPDACRDVGHDPPGQDGHVEAVGPCRGDATETAQRTLGERLDPRDCRVARADREGAVEIDDDEERRSRGDQRVERAGDLSAGRHGRIRLGRSPRPRAPPARVTAGCRPRA